MNQTDSKTNFLRLVIIGGALICFAFIAYAVSSKDVLTFDTVIREWVYERRSPVLNAVFITITYMGNWQTVIGVGLIMLILPRLRKPIGVPLTAAAIGSTVIYKAAKMIFQRPRPDIAVRLITEGGYSFPSGHSMNCIVFYGMLIYLVRKYCHNKKIADVLTALLTLLIAGIGFSRIYVGVHFPTDVLGGWSLGIAVLVTEIIILEKIRGKRDDL